MPTYSPAFDVLIYEFSGDMAHWELAWKIYEIKINNRLKLKCKFTKDSKIHNAVIYRGTYLNIKINSNRINPVLWIPWRSQLRICWKREIYLSSVNCSLFIRVCTTTSNLSCVHNVMLVWCNIYHKMIQQQADKNELVWFRRLKGRTSCCICDAVVCMSPTSLQTAGWKYSAGTGQCRGEAGKTESCRCTCLIGSLKKQPMTRH